MSSDSQLQNKPRDVQTNSTCRYSCWAENMFDLCSDSVPEMCGSYPEHIVSLIGDQQCQMYFHVCHWASRRTKEKNTPYVLHQLAMARFAWAVDNLKHRQYTSKTKMMTWRVQNVFASVCVCFCRRTIPRVREIKVKVVGWEMRVPC